MAQIVPCDEHHFRTMPPQEAAPYGYRMVSHCVVCDMVVCGTTLAVRVPSCAKHAHSPYPDRHA